MWHFPNIRVFLSSISHSKPSFHHYSCMVSHFHQENQIAQTNNRKVASPSPLNSDLSQYEREAFGFITITSLFQNKLYKNQIMFIPTIYLFLYCVHPYQRKAYQYS